MQKNYRLSKKQEGTFFDYSRGTDLKVQFNSNKKHLPHGALTPPHLPQVTSTLKLDGYGWQ